MVPKTMELAVAFISLSAANVSKINKTDLRMVMVLRASLYRLPSQDRTRAYEIP